MMSGNGNGDDDDKPLFELKLSLGDSGPTMAQEMEKAREAKLQLKQEIEAGQHEAPVKAAMGHLDDVFNDNPDLNTLSQGEQGALKRALATELLAGKWDTEAIGYVAMDAQSGSLVCKHNDFMYTSINSHAVLEVYQAELDVAATMDKNVLAQNISTHNTPEDSSLDTFPNDKEQIQERETLDTSSVEQADQSDTTTSTTHQLPQFETSREIPEQDLTDHDRALHTELDQLKQELVPSLQESQERLAQEQELNHLIREMAEIEQTAEREEIMFNQLQKVVEDNDNHLLNHLEAEDPARINQQLAQDIAENYRYSNIDVNQLSIETTYGLTTPEGEALYGVMVENQHYMVNLSQDDNLHDTNTETSNNTEELQARINELQAIKHQEQLNEEQIVEHILEIQEAQAERVTNYYLALESQEENILQNKEDTPLFNNDLVTNDTTAEATESNSTSATSIEVTEMTPEQHITHMHNNFGFQKETTLTMQKLESALDEQFPDLAQKDKDYLFNRLIGGFVYEGFSWDSTAGNLNDDFPNMSHEEMLQHLGIDKEDYDKLRYQVRVQNQIVSNNKDLSWKELREDQRKDFLESYNKANGANFSSGEFGKVWDTQYNAMKEQGDYAHQSITTATILHKGSWHDSARLWLGSESRVDDMSGWLGDATIKTEDHGWFSEKTVQFGADDYKADLDADNITHLMDKNDWSFKEASHHYYNDYLANGNSRATLFKEHTSYEYAQQEIMRELGITNLETMKEKQPDAYNFLMNLKDGNHEMKAY